MEVKMKLGVFLVIIILCISCVRREENIIQKNTGNYDPTSTFILDNSDIATNNLEPIDRINDKLVSMPFDITLTPQLQEIIKNYASTVLDSSFYVNTLAFQLEGNFTGSGNREIVGFYELLPSSSMGTLNIAFCFVLDLGGERIENVYTINYRTGEFLDLHESITGLNEYLGKSIIWRDRIIGKAGDFNGNGKDELYLFSLSGLSFAPVFLEFNGIEFVEIIEFEYATEITIIDVEPENRIITLREKVIWDETGMYLTERINSYIWDEAIQMYEIMFTERKNYRWNRNLQQYEEIE